MGGEDLEALEAMLRKPDAVLEPQVMETLRSYVISGGQPPKVVELLSRNYVGYAQMASLVCNWLKLTEGDSGDGDDDQHQHQHQQKQKQKRQRQDTHHGEDEDPEHPEHSEFFFLQKLVKEQFDLEKFDSVFSTAKGKSKPPKWLDGIAADPQGRQLIYDLSGEHKNCLLLNFAIQKILYQGHENEVASVGSSLAGYFGVFHRLMVTRLRAIAAAAPQELPGEVASLANACCQDLHSYAHVQLVVSELGRRPGAGGARFRRLSQELEAIAARDHGGLVWMMQPSFVGSSGGGGGAEGASREPEEHHRVVQLVGEALASTAQLESTGSGAPGSSSAAPVATSDAASSTVVVPISAAAVRRLSEAYSGPHPPPVEPLRHPRLLKALTSALFTPEQGDGTSSRFGADSDKDLSAQHMQLLALASAGVDSSLGSSYAEGDETTDTSDVPGCRDAIECAYAAAKDAMKGIKADEAAVASPAAALGAMHFMEATLSHLDFYRSAACLTATPVFLNLLNNVAVAHPAMRPHVVDIVARSLSAMGNSKPQLARQFLDLAVLLLSYGEAEAVMEMADAWEKIADPSLVRHLVMQVLGVAAPPYSPEFALWLLRLVKVGSVRKMRDAPRGSSEAYLLEEFASSCAEVEFPRNLSAREAALLKELAGAS